jgi:hypothetical protein
VETTDVIRPAAAMTDVIRMLPDVVTLPPAFGFIHFSEIKAVEVLVRIVEE